MKRIRYKDVRVVDGDTVHMLIKGVRWTARIRGLDTDELNGKYHDRAVQQKKELERLFSKWVKPRIYAEIRESRQGWPYIKVDNSGRWLCEVKIRSFFWRWVDYADYMIGKGMVKKNSKWNTGSKKG